MDWLSLCIKGLNYAKNILDFSNDGKSSASGVYLMKYALCALAVLLVVSVCGLIALNIRNTTLQNEIADLQNQLTTQNALITAQKANEERLQSSLDSYKAKVDKQFKEVVIPSNNSRIDGSASAMGENEAKSDSECMKFIDNVLKAYYE